MSCDCLMSYPVQSYSTEEKNLKCTSPVSAYGGEFCSACFRMTSYTQLIESVWLSSGMPLQNCSIFCTSVCNHTCGLVVSELIWDCNFLRLFGRAGKDPSNLIAQKKMVVLMVIMPQKHICALLIKKGISSKLDISSNPHDQPPYCSKF